MKTNKLNTLLMDLDGTLLKLDMDSFLPKYMDDVAAFVNYDGGKKLFLKAFWTASLAMVEDSNPQKTNEEVFFHTFCSLVGSSREKWQVLFERYYRERFPLLGELSTFDPVSVKIVEEARRKNFFLVLATNPVFPRVAIEERLKWADLKSHDFDFITSFENMHFCKPNPGYYREILQKINRSPQQCLMLGNDAVEDMAAGEIGITTYLVEDMLIESKKQAPKYDFRGTLQDFLSFLQDLPPAL